jgi:nitroimidazol reductase NimA-like FMN-containing flavoprotein (pyridoxamine 5'-phosphate oxidase superfamily)
MSTRESGAAELDREERADLLGTGGTGVLSFSRGADEPPHSIPVSYGYDAATETFYFRLAVGPDSEKADLLDHGVSLVVHDHDDERWRSVVASGRLEATDDDAVGTEALAGLDRSHIPLFDVFDEPDSKVPFAFYRLVPDSLTGRRESVVRD